MLTFDNLLKMKEELDNFPPSLTKIICGKKIILYFYYIFFLDNKKALELGQIRVQYSPALKENMCICYFSDGFVKVVRISSWQFFIMDIKSYLTKIKNIIDNLPLYEIYKRNRNEKNSFVS
jgi:hypothetical protein